MEYVSKNAWNKFNDPNYGSNGNPYLDEKARKYMSCDQIWESLKRIDELKGLNKN